MAKDAKANKNDSNYENKIIKKSQSKNSNTAIGYLTLKARIAFIQFKKVFNKAPILWYFDPEYYIRIKTSMSDYAIDKVPS